MKIIHLYAQSDLDVMPVVQKALDQGLLVGNIALVTTIQHVQKMNDVVAFLKEKNISCTFYGNMLGCQPPKQMNEKTILYIGDGMFHPKGLLLKYDKENDKKIIIANPASQEVRVLEQNEIETIKKRIKGARLTFLNAKHVGVLLSVKSGQKTVQQTVPGIMKIQEKYPDKKFYFFTANTLNIQSLEDFPFVEVWVNTMCPRMVDDDTKFPKPMINLMDLEL